MVVTLKDGKNTIFAENERDLVYLIREYLSDDVSIWVEDYIQKLIKEADYTDRKVNTDLNSYESQLENQNSAFSEISEQLDNLKEYIDDTTKKMTKKNVLGYIKSIEDILNYYF